MNYALYQVEWAASPTCLGNNMGLKDAVKMAQTLMYDDCNSYDVDRLKLAEYGYIIKNDDNEVVFRTEFV